MLVFYFYAMKNYFLIGDIHGCYHTFMQLLEYVNHDTDQIIQLGDIIDRGNYIDSCVEQAFILEKEHAAIFLMGNHEFDCLQHFNEKHNGKWIEQGGMQTLSQFSQSEKQLSFFIDWLKLRTYFYQTEHVFFSHAGISHADDPFDYTHRESILWNRQPIKNIGKTQAVGHTPTSAKEPLFLVEGNCWNVDTGAYKGNGLSALRLNERGEKMASYFVPTHPKDILKL